MRLIKHTTPRSKFNSHVCIPRGLISLMLW